MSLSVLLILLVCRYQAETWCEVNQLLQNSIVLKCGSVVTESRLKHMDCDLMLFLKFHQNASNSIISHHKMSFIFTFGIKVGGL